MKDIKNIVDFRFLMIIITSMSVVTTEVVSNATTTIFKDPPINDEEKNLCFLLNCEESGLSCCKPIFVQKHTPSYVCCNPNTQEVPVIAICSSIAALLFILCVYCALSYLIQRKAKQEARNPPPFKIALTMELNSKPVLPPNYYDVMNGKVELTTGNEKDETPPPPFEDVRI